MQFTLFGLAFLVSAILGQDTTITILFNSTITLPGPTNTLPTPTTLGAAEGSSLQASLSTTLGTYLPLDTSTIQGTGLACGNTGTLSHSGCSAAVTSFTGKPTTHTSITSSHTSTTSGIADKIQNNAALLGIGALIAAFIVG